MGRKDTINLLLGVENQKDIHYAMPIRNMLYNGDALHELVVNNEDFKNISRDTAVMMCEFADIKLPRKNKVGKYDMCKAITDLEKKNQELGADNALIKAIKSIMKKQEKSFEEVCNLMGISNVDMKRYKKMI